MKTKKIYNPPITEMVEVEFEGGFMAGSMKGDEVETGSVTSGNQEIEGNYDFTDNEWE